MNIDVSYTTKFTVYNIDIKHIQNFKILITPEYTDNITRLNVSKVFFQ